MEEGGEMAKDLTIALEDRAGILAELGEALGGASINIEGFCGYRSEGTGIVHLLVDDAIAARGALEAAGFTVQDERDVLVVDVEDRPGALGVVARRISNANVSLDLAYLGTNTRIVVGADDLETLRAAM
jgi:hypothetical protein